MLLSQPLLSQNPILDQLNKAGLEQQAETINSQNADISSKQAEANAQSTYANNLRSVKLEIASSLALVEQAKGRLQVAFEEADKLFNELKANEDFVILPSLQTSYNEVEYYATFDPNSITIDSSDYVAVPLIGLSLEQNTELLRHQRELALTKKRLSQTQSAVALIVSYKVALEKTAKEYTKALQDYELHLEKLIESKNGLKTTDMVRSSEIKALDNTLLSLIDRYVTAMENPLAADALRTIISEEYTKISLDGFVLQADSLTLSFAPYLSLSKMNALDVFDEEIVSLKTTLYQKTKFITYLEGCIAQVRGGMSAAQPGLQTMESNTNSLEALDGVTPTPETLLEQAKEMIESKRYDDARTLLLSSIRLGSDVNACEALMNEISTIGLARTALQNEEWSEAKILYNQLLTEDKSKAEIFLEESRKKMSRRTFKSYFD